jgi:hypothetical protein
MARATTCRLDGQEIDIHEALRVRDQARRGSYPDFRCVECDQLVRPHKENGGPAHFEHRSKNRDCRLSDPR